MFVQESYNYTFSNHMTATGLSSAIFTTDYYYVKEGLKRFFAIQPMCKGVFIEDEVWVL